MALQTLIWMLNGSVWKKTHLHPKVNLLCQLAGSFRLVYVEIAKNQTYKIVSESILALTIKWHSLLGRILLIYFVLYECHGNCSSFILKSSLVTMFPRSRPFQVSRRLCSFNPNKIYNTTAMTGVFITNNYLDLKDFFFFFLVLFYVAPKHQRLYSTEDTTESVNYMGKSSHFTFVWTWTVDVLVWNSLWTLGPFKMPFGTRPCLQLSQDRKRELQWAYSKPGTTRRSTSLKEEPLICNHPCVSTSGGWYLALNQNCVRGAKYCLQIPAKIKTVTLTTSRLVLVMTARTWLE